MRFTPITGPITLLLCPGRAPRNLGVSPPISPPVAFSSGMWLSPARKSREQAIAVAEQAEIRRMEKEAKLYDIEATGAAYISEMKACRDSETEPQASLV